MQCPKTKTGQHKWHTISDGSKIIQFCELCGIDYSERYIDYPYPLPLDDPLTQE